MERGHCATIHVRDERQDGIAYMTSAWATEPLEAGWLLAGANVHLSISAPQHPVVAMTIGEPPEEFEPVYTITHLPHPQGRKAIRVMRYAPPRLCVYADALLGDEGMAIAVAKAMGAIEDFIAANLPPANIS